MDTDRDLNVRFYMNSSDYPTTSERTENCSASWPHLANLATVEFIIPMMILIIFNCVVIAGNILVVVAVFSHTKLRTVTNTFIVSLAVADLLLGVSVLPFSSANEVLRYWPFGKTWCDIWLAIDVWVCTASILNLCAISLDRYLAITRPFKYPRLMTHRHAKILVASVWIVSFVICFPPLIGWKGASQELDQSQNVTDVTNTTVIDVYITQPLDVIFNVSSVDSSLECSKGGSPTCILTAEPGYIIYSALGSFWIPVWIMFFFYWRIYRAAIKTTSAIRRGVLTTKASCYPQSSSTSPEHQVTLRVHRGGGGSRSVPHSPEENSNNGRLVPAHNGRHHSADHGTLRKMSSSDKKTQSERLPLGVKEPQSKNGLLHKGKRSKGVRITFSKPGTQHSYTGERQPLRASCSSDGHALHPLRNPHQVRNGTKIENIEESQFSTDNTAQDSRSSTGFLNKVSRIQLKNNMKRMNREKKAAKTVGIIVGCFIFCWAPFFTVYLLGAFCDNCTPEMLFTIFFWLGYCNSAVNPFLYAMCSKDFRYAFKKLLRCRVERRRMERKNTKFMNFINSIRIQISSKGSDSNSE